MEEKIKSWMLFRLIGVTTLFINLLIIVRNYEKLSTSDYLFFIAFIGLSLFIIGSSYYNIKKLSRK